jgi:cholesterol oxidase
VTHYDVLIVGSGFGGSVTALRLAEKGYRVGVLEAGRRFEDEDFPTTSWKVRDYLFAPALGCFGIQRMNLLKDVLILSGAGVGGGSLVYANTLYEPREAFYRDPAWAHLADWKSELEPAYATAKRMLGATTYPRRTPSDDAMEKVAAELGVADTQTPTQVGVLFGLEDLKPGTRVADPFFDGAGPERTTCLHCGSCMTGCRFGAKNTLTKNYLYLAEKAGAIVHPMTTVTDVRPNGSGYRVQTRHTGAIRRETFTADEVVFAASALGTQRLLHHVRDRGSLPDLSPRLGELARTNSESILAVRARGDDVDYSEGVAITSSIHLDEHTHIEPVRYGRGSNLMGMLGAVLTDPESDRPRWRVGVREFIRQRRDLKRLHTPRGWSEQTITLLTMQNVDNSLTTYTKRRPWGRRVLTTRQGIGDPNPVWIPAAHDFARRLGEEIDGIPTGTITDLMNIPTTGHFIGGCPMGVDREHGVIDRYHRVHGYPGLHVIDGSAIAANLGVNPSLTIAAMAELAASYWPRRGEADQRPPLR